jgi:hypothetical protein
MRRAPGTLDLCFVNHAMLTSIICSLGCIYYLFDHIGSKRGKKWKNLDEELVRDPGVMSKKGRKESFHINLAWKGIVDVTILTNNKSWRWW